MSTQWNVRNSQSATSVFLERITNDKNISKPTKRQRENPESHVLVANTGTSSSLSQETLQIPTSGFRCKEKIALKVFNFNDKKARYESHKTFLSKCHREKIIPH